MKWVVVVLALIVLALVSWRIFRGAPRLRVDDNAPEFQLVDQQGTMRQLSAYRGCWLVLYFYPKDDTPGCTREACQFRDDLHTLEALNAQVAGISVDTAVSHARFAATYHLPFPLLADTEGKVAAAYEALFKLGPLKIARRVTFIITPEGRIAHIFRHINSAQHAVEVARTLKALQVNHAPPRQA